MGLGCLQALTRRSSGVGDSRTEVSRGDEPLTKLKSGGATELSGPEFDIAEAVRKAEEANQERVEEEFQHIEVPPSPPLSPLKSSSDDEVMEDVKIDSEKSMEETEGEHRLPLSTCGL